MVLRVRDFPGYVCSQLISHLSDNFDCGDWLLFEVRIRCERRRTRYVYKSDRLGLLKLGRGGLSFTAE